MMIDRRCFAVVVRDSRNVRVPQIFSRWLVQKLMTSLINSP